MSVDQPPEPPRRGAPGIVAPSNRVNVALPFSTMRIEEPSSELAELVAIVSDLLGALDQDGGEEIARLRARAEALATRLR